MRNAYNLPDRLEAAINAGRCVAWEKPSIGAAYFVAVDHVPNDRFYTHAGERLYTAHYLMDWGAQHRIGLVQFHESELDPLPSGALNWHPAAPPAEFFALHESLGIDQRPRFAPALA